MYAGAVEHVNDGVAINPVRERPRTAADRGCRPVRRWPVCSARNRPRPAPRQRPGPAFGLVLLGDPPSFDEDDTDPHCCVKPLDAVALPSRAATAACRSSTWADGLLFGADGVAATVSRDRVRPGMPPRPPRLPQAPRQSRLRCRTPYSVPSCPANVPKVSRGRRLPYLDVHAARNRAPGASGSIRPRRPSSERRGVSVPTRVHLPTQLRHTRVSRHCALAPRRRQPRAMAAAPAPDFHRLSGLPVCRDGSRPRRHRAAPTWLLR